VGDEDLTLATLKKETYKLESASDDDSAPPPTSCAWEAGGASGVAAGWEVATKSPFFRREVGERKGKDLWRGRKLITFVWRIFFINSYRLSINR
jgi:hypothetical protein